MKSVSKFLLLVFFSLSATVLLQAQSEVLSAKDLNDQGYKRYEVKSGIVKYKLEGSNTGTEELYFDTWGWREGKHTKSTMNMMGMNVEENKANILDGMIQYSLDKNTMNATKMKNPLLQGWTANNDTDNKNLSEVGKDMLKSMGGEKVGNGEVLGKPCEMWMLESFGTKMWIWKGIALKFETDFMGVKYTSTATEIQVDVSVPDDKLTLPSGANITMDMIGNEE